mgnify:CR=1 FL=1
MTRESALHQVIHRRLRSLFRKQLLVLARSYKLGNFRIRIVQIAPVAGAGRAQLHAGRHISAIDEVLAERALLHDVLVVLTFYAISRISVGNTFIACMLTIVGYSINATIVIFDRIRENMKGSRAKLDEIVNESITQTLTRSIYTTLTTFVMVFMIFIMGVSSIREFTLPLMTGMIAGAFSSVFITGSLWYVLKGKKSDK